MKRTLILLFMAGCLAVLGSIYFAVQTIRAPLPITQPVVFEVAPGDHARSVLNRLHQQGLLPYPPELAFVWLRWHGVAEELRVGEYRLPVSPTLDDLWTLFASGRSIQYQLQLLEGWTLLDIQRALSAAEGLQLTLTDFSPTGLALALGLSADSAEGQFLPDTWHYSRGSLDRDLLLRAHQALRQTLEQAWEARSEEAAAVLKTPDEALILASIIEKETGRSDERAVISGVFVSRLQQGMKLQTDPTVIYGLGDRFDGNLTRAHLREATPFNTYVIPALPPAPIALASRASILAATQPDVRGYLFFVGKGDGSHHFSRTLDEHNAAVRRYQLNRREDYRSH